MKEANPLAPPSESTGPAAALAYAWGQYRVWENTSQKLKKQLTLWRIAVLIFTILGAVLGILSSQAADFGPYPGKMPVFFSTATAGQVLAFLSAVAIGLAAFIGREALSPERERRWVIARSMAEACKSECFKFSTGTLPYDEARAWRVLLDEIDKLEQTMEGVLVSVIIEEERQIGLPAMGLSARDYLKERVRDQIGYYDGQAQRSEKKMERGRRITWMLGVMGVVLGAAGSLFEITGAGAWVAVTANLTAAVTSYVLAERFSYLAISYRVTADRLRSLEAGWNSQASPQKEDFHGLVRRCEEVISIENKRWLVEWTKKKAAQEAPGGAEK